MLTKLKITSREPVLDGKSFGAVGPYEALLGSAQFALDPNHVLNQPIADLGLAPVDAQGQVTFQADVYLLKPVVPSAVLPCRPEMPVLRASASTRAVFPELLCPKRATFRISSGRWAIWALLLGQGGWRGAGDSSDLHSHSSAFSCPARDSYAAP